MAAPRIQTTLNDGSKIDLKSIFTSGDYDMSVQTIDIDDIVIPINEDMQDHVINGDGVAKRDETKRTLDELDKSIRLYGQIMPIFVFKKTDLQDPSKSKYHVIDGMKRLFVQSRRGIDTKVKAIVLPYDLRQSTSLIRILSNQKVKPGQKSLIDSSKSVYSSIIDVNRSEIEAFLGLRTGELSIIEQIVSDSNDQNNDDHNKITEIFGLLSGGDITVSEAKSKISSLFGDERLEKLKKDNNGNDSETSGNQGSVQKAQKDDSEGLSDASGDKKPNGNIKPEDYNEQRVTDDNAAHHGLADDPNAPDPDAKLAEEAEQQFVGERHRLDPEIRTKVLKRDHYMCQVCGVGRITDNQDHGNFITPQLEIHHMQEVQYGGRDHVDNLITLCSSCHKLITNYGEQKKYTISKGGGVLFDPTEQDLNEKPQYWLIYILGIIEHKAYRDAVEALKEDSERYNKGKIYRRFANKTMTIGQAIKESELEVIFSFNAYDVFKETLFKTYQNKLRDGVEIDIVNRDLRKQAIDYNEDKPVEADKVQPKEVAVDGSSGLERPAKPGEIEKKSDF